MVKRILAAAAAVVAAVATIWVANAAEAATQPAAAKPAAAKTVTSAAASTATREARVPTRIPSPSRRDRDWNSGKKWHIDLWAGGDKDSTKNPEKSALLNCEDALTRNGQIIINPAGNLPVDTKPIFDPKTRTCHHP